MASAIRSGRDGSFARSHLEIYPARPAPSGGRVAEQCRAPREAREASAESLADDARGLRKLAAGDFAVARYSQQDLALVRNRRLGSSPPR